MNITEIETQVKNALSWRNVCNEVAILENGNIAIALLDVIDDWGEHLSNASDAEDVLIEKLGVRSTDCQEEIAILDEMGLEDPHCSGWEETWRVVVLEQ